MCITLEGKNALAQYSDSKRCHGYEHHEVQPACEHVPFDALVAWNGLDSVTPILAGEQYPPMASFIAAPTMAEAVSHAIRVTRAIALIR